VSQDNDERAADRQGQRQGEDHEKHEGEHFARKPTQAAWFAHQQVAQRSLRPFCGEVRGHNDERDRNDQRPRLANDGDQSLRRGESMNEVGHLRSGGPGRDLVEGQVGDKSAGEDHHPRTCQDAPAAELEQFAPKRTHH
jgi:hypothetical protein